jgi:Ca-activated chloride channel family protein
MTRTLTRSRRLVLAVWALTALGSLALVWDTRAAGARTLELLFIYGSEKEEWIKEVTKAFNDARHRTGAGNAIHVKAVPLGSGETIDEVMSGRQKAHLVSPASKAFIVLGNADSRKKLGRDLIGPTRDLVRSPVVIAMWKPMAQALGWGKKSVGWSDILKLSRDPRGWAAVGKPHFKAFKFGHTHPDYSNSGLISLFAEAYFATRKTEGLTVADIQRPAVAADLEAIERSVVHYGSSTGFFGKTLYQSGMSYLSAAVLYENMVIESYQKVHLEVPLVAIYPKEGTFWSDHPVGIVQRPWVTSEHEEAAEVYIKYLLDRPQQQKALKWGFRPGDPGVALASPIDARHGVDPNEPKFVLKVPTPEVMRAIRQLWTAKKKRSRVVFVIDTSRSMIKEQRMKNAQTGALALLERMGDRDTAMLLSFSDKPAWVTKEGQEVTLNKAGRRKLERLIREELFCDGETALYDAIDTAHRYLQNHPKPEMINAIVVLTDGEDNKSKMTLKQLLRDIDYKQEKPTTRIFTIAYGTPGLVRGDADPKVLEKIAKATQAKFYKSTPKTIRSVFKDIATFFGAEEPPER